MNKKTFLSSMVFGLTTAAIISSPAIAKKSSAEKCYGVAKAGKNDCADLKGKHSCAGAAAVDGDANEWVYLPKGTCDKIVGGTLNS